MTSHKFIVEKVTHASILENLIGINIDNLMHSEKQDAISMLRTISDNFHNNFNNKDEKVISYYLSKIGNMDEIPQDVLVSLYNKMGSRLIEMMLKVPDKRTVHYINFLSRIKIQLEITDSLFAALLDNRAYFIIMKNENFEPCYYQFIHICNFLRQTYYVIADEYYTIIHMFFIKNQHHLKAWLNYDDSFLKLIINVTHKKLFCHLIHILIFINFPMDRLINMISEQMELNNIRNINNLYPFICNKIVTINAFNLYKIDIENMRFILKQNITDFDTLKIYFIYKSYTSASIIDYKLEKSVVHQYPHLLTKVMQTNTFEEALIKNWKLDFVRMFNYGENVGRLLI